MAVNLSTATRRLARGPWVDLLGHAGLAAKGISFVLVGVLAILVAVGHGGETTDRQGALRAVAQHPFGKVALLVLAVGFAGYALWRLADAVLDLRDEGDDASGLAKRAASVAKAAIYFALLWTTISILIGSGNGGGQGEQKATGGVLGWPGGRELVFLAALALAGAAAFNAYRGITRKFEEKLTGMGDVAERAAVTLGVVGHVARGTVFALVAWFLAKAAIQYDPQNAVGLDGALARLAREPYGKALLGLTAAGLLAYGIYCLFEARYRDLER
jgi:fumarate reductase subunit D